MATTRLLEGGQLVDHRDGSDIDLKLRDVRTQFGDTGRARQARPRRLPRRDRGPGRRLGHAASRSCCGPSSASTTPRKGTIEVLGNDRAARPSKTARCADRRTVPGRGAVLLAHRGGEHHRADPRTYPRLEEGLDARDRRPQVSRWSVCRRIRPQKAVGTVGRHAQARQPGPRAGARSRRSCSSTSRQTHFAGLGV